MNVMGSVRGDGFSGCIGARGSQREKKGNSVRRMGFRESEGLNGDDGMPC